jgi:NAD(P)H-flavin reductase
MAGGTGVTPMVQLLEYALMNDTDATRFTLLFAAKNERDHLLSDKLNELAQKHSNRLRIRYFAETLSPESRTTWSGGIGRITESDIVNASVWQVDEPRASLVMVCGPSG